MAQRLSALHERCPLYYLQESYKYTPDFKELKNSKKDEFLVLIVGNMQLGKPLAHCLTGANYYGKAMTMGSDYMMKRTSPAGPPFVLHLKKRFLKNGIMVPPHMVGKIEGDLVGVPLRMLTKLDIVEENTGCSTRERKWVNLLHSDQNNSHAEAFVYCADQEFYEEAFFDITKLPGVSTMEQGGTKRFYYL